jgi:hypothetical protein
VGERLGDVATYMAGLFPVVHRELLQVNDAGHVVAVELLIQGTFELAGRLRAGLHVRAHEPIVAARENHQDPVTTFHLPSGECGLRRDCSLGRQGTCPRDSREIP